MWEDFKKLGSLVINQSKEQKDILMLKLRIISFDNKKDSALTRLGALVFRAHGEGVKAPHEDAKVVEQLKELDEIDKEMEDSNTLLNELKEKTKEERTEIATQLGDTWGKTREKLTSINADTEDDKAKPTTSGEPGKATVEKVTKATGESKPKPKQSSAPSAKTAKKTTPKKPPKKDVE